MGLIDIGVDFLGLVLMVLWIVMVVYIWKWVGVMMIYWLVVL